MALALRKADRGRPEVQALEDGTEPVRLPESESPTAKTHSVQGNRDGIIKLTEVPQAF